MSPEQITSRSVRLVDMQGMVQEAMPAARMIENFNTHSVEIHARFMLTMQDYITVVPTPEHAEKLLAAAVERLRLEAIHGLGLAPRIRANEEQVERYREANRTLQAVSDQRAARIVELEERVAFLELDPEERELHITNE